MPFNEALRLVTDVEVMVMDDRGNWNKDTREAFWDTGSTWTAISKKFADELGARLEPSSGVTGIASWQESWKTIVNLRIGDIVIPFEQIEVVDYKGPMRPDIVIGMTTILKGRMTVETEDDRVILTFEL